MLDSSLCSKPAGFPGIPMGNSYGHIIPGLGYLLIGLWHLYSHIKLHCQHPKTYNPPIWFPAPKVRHLELHFILFGSLTYLFTELFVGPSSHHHPLDPNDWSIPATHIHNFEHVAITIPMSIYAAFAIRIDRLRVRPSAGRTLSLLLASHMFAAEFLMFYLHSTDHAGLEWQYHRLLLTAVAPALVTTLMGIGYPRSFAVGFARSVSVVLQGLWYIILGAMLYTPKFLPRGCHVRSVEGFLHVPCDDHASLHRAKALVNLQFAWALVAVVVFSGWLYLRMSQMYPREVAEYECLGKEGGQDHHGFPESPKKIKKPEQENSGGLTP